MSHSDLTFPALRPAYSIEPSWRRPIAIVGAGRIVDTAHLPAYALAELPVAGLFDLDVNRAATVAAKHSLGVVYRTLDELWADTDVDVVDVALPPDTQPAIVRAALNAGKHVLCQKPLATKTSDAVAMVNTAVTRGRQLGVNQQLRHEDGLRTAAALLVQGRFGDPQSLTFRARGSIDWSSRRWTRDAARLELPLHAIHYLDAIRFLFGEPDTVRATIGRRAGGQAVRGETRVQAILRYADGRTATLDSDHDNADEAGGASFLVEGSDGSLHGDLRWTQPSVLTWQSSRDASDRTTQAVRHAWQPYAFAGPMTSLLGAVAGAGSPQPSADDNLKTLRIVDAIYAAAASGRTLRLQPVERPKRGLS